MHKIAFLLTFLLFSFGMTNAQMDSTYARTNRTGMFVLGGWAVANLGAGVTGALTTDGSTQRFHEFNAMWNTVNLGLAIGGVLGTRKAKLKPLEPMSIREYRHKQQKIFLVNAGLDVGYITGGFLLREMGRSRTGEAAARFKGYGTSLILQGGFLLVFDTIMAILNKPGPLTVRF